MNTFPKFAFVSILLLLCTPLFSQMSDCSSAKDAKQRMDTKAQAIITKEREIFLGMVCSQCKRPATQIWKEELVSFPQHLQAVHGIPIASTLTKYQATQKMQGDYDELAALERIYKTYSTRCGMANTQSDDRAKESGFYKKLNNDQYVSYSQNDQEGQQVIPQASANSLDPPEELQQMVPEDLRVNEDDIEQSNFAPATEGNRLTKIKSGLNIFFKKKLAELDVEELAWSAIIKSAPNEVVKGNLKTIKEFCRDEMVIKATENIEKCATDETQCAQLQEQIDKAPLTLARTLAKNHFSTYKKVVTTYTKKALIKLEKWTR